VRLDPRNFSRKATTTPGFLEDTGRATSGGAGRPATLYRAAPNPGTSPGSASGVTTTPGSAADPDLAPASVPAVLDPPLMRPRR